MARRSGDVAALIGGAVGEMHVEVGDRVIRGDILTVIMSERLEAERDRAAAVVTERRAMVQTAQAELEKANRELRRIQGLQQSAAHSQARFDDASQDAAMLEGELLESQAQLRQAQAQLELAAIDVANSEVMAPYDGVVSDRHAEVGDYVGIGSPVVTLVNDEDIEIEAEVPTERLAGLESGMLMDVTLDDGTSHAAILRAIVPVENPRTRTRPVRLVPDFGPTLKPLARNQSVTVHVPSGPSRDVVTVHKDAIVRRGGNAIVYVVEDGAAQVRPVQLGDAVGTRFAVAQGLKPGDIVVVRGNEALRPGQQVRTAGG